MHDSDSKLICTAFSSYRDCDEGTLLNPVLKEASVNCWLVDLVIYSAGKMFSDRIRALLFANGKTTTTLTTDNVENCYFKINFCFSCKQ